MKRSTGDKIFHTLVYALLVLLAFVCFYPFWNSIVISFNLGSDTELGGITFWPRSFTLQNYSIVFQDGRLLDAFYISVMRTLIGTSVAILCTAIFSFGMSRKNLIGRKSYMLFCVFTMYFSGGLIPTYMLIRNMHLLDSFWVLVIPGIINVWNMIVFISFFKDLPDGLEESARIDGCSNFGVLFKIVLPLSGPIIATLSLFTAVSLWNDWFYAGLYITKTELLPVQALLQQILNSNIMTTELLNLNSAAQDRITAMQSITTKSLSMATMIVAVLPIMFTYPFVQKYFVKGVLVGSLKG
ncbi:MULTISPECIES: carbohydrate ABC transporter permease [Paenibacillus]|uniref:Carbohydrate ABC transporter permease n=1 Tax=Paenibacillus lignilyticus TaxID=1172615 RepID=A0ABS5CGJ5_9BACL|nr:MULTISPECIES: carbohydrate ABC transporter permease [Paenibacillus]MBP3965013.1 carbohydrate ABC transporter permease [Paenibacillus lignilyticus]SFT24274.1 carbohydrate ABC transporter membrane protein 2, CUT1 family [Paenibacillus sp. BC26]